MRDTTKRGDFIAALRSADEAFADQGIPEIVDRRLRQQLARAQEAPERRSWRPPLALAAVAVAGLVLLLVAPWESAPQPAPTLETELAGFVVTQQDDRFAATVSDDGVVSVEQGEATLWDAAAGVTLRVGVAARLARGPQGTRIEHGEVEVDVEHRERAASEPVRVFVSHGLIEVTGTSFSVVQGDGGGSVSLHDGSIRFVSVDGRVSPLAPGERLTWPVAVSPPTSKKESPKETASEPIPAPSPEPMETPVEEPPIVESRAKKASKAKAKVEAPRKPARRLSPRARAAAVVEQLTTLRSRGRFGKAASLLREAVSDRSLPRRSRERFSFELGAILSRQLRQGQRACRHWRSHLARFGHGRSGTEIQQLQRKLSCGTAPTGD